MKNVLMIIGMFAVGSVVCVVALIGIVMYEGMKYDASSQSYVDANVPPILKNWSQGELEQRESDQLRAATGKDELTKIFGMFARLGPMESYDGATGNANMNFKPSTGLEITARYKVEATFQNGKAEIQVSLIHIHGDWRILGFHVTSQALAQ